MKLRYRKDVDGLRFIAVISVVIGHYFPYLAPQGFLGVDIFFVISGYVITQLLFTMEKDRSSSFLIEFYAKRIRRIVPALLIVVIATLLVFSLFFTRLDGAMSNTGAYSLIGVSNMYLWHLSYDYFGLSASQNPFTHTWSLGVEEQFYALYPIFFILCWKLAKHRRFLTLCVLVGTTSLLSLILNIVLSITKTEFAFYSMPTRFWELGVGVLVSLVVASNLDIGKRLSDYRLIIFLLLLTTFVLGTGSIVISQIIVVLATGYLLIPGLDDKTSRFLSSNLITWVGVRSYSIYLIHWPILVLANYLLGQGTFKNIFFIPMTVLLSALMYRFIENPFRFGQFKVSAVRTISLGMPIVLLATVAIQYGAPKLSKEYNNIVPNFLDVSDVPVWIPTRCSGALNIGKLADPIPECLGGSKRSKARFVYLIGDSHADQLVSMVRKSFPTPNFLVKNLNMEDEKDFPFVDFLSKTNSPSLKFLESNAKSGDVVVLTFHRGHLNPNRDVHIPLDQIIEVSPETKNLVDNLDRFAVRMNLVGVKIILVKDTPLMASIQTSQSCALQLKIFGTNGCRVSRVQDIKTRFLQSYAFDEIAKNNNNVLTWDPFDYIYGPSRHFDVVDANGNYLMWDWNHITQYLSTKLASNFKSSIINFIDY